MGELGGVLLREGVTVGQGTTLRGWQLNYYNYGKILEIWLVIIMSKIVYI